MPNDLENETQQNNITEEEPKSTIGLVASDGTTIVFYDASSEHLYKNDVLLNFTGEPGKWKKDENELKNAYKKADKDLIKAFEAATETLENIANIRFVDVNDLGSVDI